MPIVPVRPISLCSIGVSPVEFVNSWYFGLIFIVFLLTKPELKTSKLLSWKNIFFNASGVAGK